MAMTYPRKNDDRLQLSPDILLTAYIQGIFPMDVEGTIQWFSPDPRAIIDPDRFRISKNLAQQWRNLRWTIKVNTRFEEVIRACARREDGTWISGEIIEAYTLLNHLGFAHSLEVWDEDELIGGLYGVALGGVFFGESMFHRTTNASKIALVALVERMRQRNMPLLDIQFMTAHLSRFGAEEIPRSDYMARLRQALAIETNFV